MKFKIMKKEMVDKNISASMFNGKNKKVMPILECVKIVADKEKQKVSFISTDLELSISLELEAEVFESGCAVVNLSMLMAVIANMPNDPIIFSTENDNLVIKCNNSKLSLILSDVELFPIFPDVNIEGCISLEAGMLKQMINYVRFSASLNEFTVYSGIYWEISKEEITMAATDGVKISEFKIIKNNEIEESNSIILPVKTANMLAKILSSGKEIKINFYNGKVSFICEGYTIISSVVEGTYPNYKSIFPKDKPTLIYKADNKQLKSSI